MLIVFFVKDLFQLVKQIYYFWMEQKRFEFVLIGGVKIGGIGNHA
jgi:hypothetical protein